METRSIKSKQTNILPVDKSIFEKLRDGRAFTLIELSDAVNSDRKTTERLLQKLIEEGRIKVRGNRKRIYYYIEKDLPANESIRQEKFSMERPLPVGMKYCRHCYHHLAGYVGVKISEALVRKNILSLNHKELQYSVTDEGWKWFAKLGIIRENFDPKRPLAKACLDFSERKNHLGGQLGDIFLKKMLKMEWAKQVPDSREIQLTKKGKLMLQTNLLLNL